MSQEPANKTKSTEDPLEGPSPRLSAADKEDIISGLFKRLTEANPEAVNPNKGDKSGEQAQSTAPALGQQDSQ